MGILSPSLLSLFIFDSLHDRLFPDQSHKELKLETELLENYFLLISAIEDNLHEFKVIKEELNEIVQEVKALAALDEGSTVGSIKRIGSSVSQSHLSPPYLPPPPPPPQPGDRRKSSVVRIDLLL